MQRKQKWVFFSEQSVVIIHRMARLVEEPINLTFGTP